MTAATPIEIIIADDHPLFLKSLKLVINETSDFKLVGEAATSILKTFANSSFSAGTGHNKFRFREV